MTATSVAALMACLVWVAPAEAEWLYVLVEPSGQSTVYNTPPVDLAYPPPGEPTPMLTVGEPNQGTPLTPEEAKKLREAPHLIIYDTLSLEAGGESQPPPGGVGQGAIGGP
jgi:hypothetical protein